MGIEPTPEALLPEMPDLRRLQFVTHVEPNQGCTTKFCIYSARPQLRIVVLDGGPTTFSPSSVQFKGEINDALPRKRHQQRHLEFCTAYLLSRGSGVRVSPGAPLQTFANHGITTSASSCCTSDLGAERSKTLEI